MALEGSGEIPWARKPPHVEDLNRLAVPQGIPDPHCNLSLEDAKDRGLCRVCGESTRIEVRKLVVMNRGEEHAHADCLKWLKSKTEGTPMNTDLSEGPAPDEEARVVDARIAGDVRPNYYRVPMLAARVDTGEVVEVEVECFQMIRALGLGFFDGNVLKYLWRAGRKTKDRLADAKKVLTYARQALNDAEAGSQ